MTVVTATLPPEFGRHWVKRLARLMDVPQETARHWAFRRLPAERRREIARALVAECARLEIVIADTKRRWAEVAGDETGSAVARRGADQARPQVGRMGGKVKL